MHPDRQFRAANAATYEHEYRIELASSFSIASLSSSYLRLWSLELNWHILIYRHSRFGLAKNVSGLTRTGSRNGNGRRLCDYPGFRSRQRILFNRQWAPAIIRLSMPITPEDRARQSIDQLLTAAGWIIQNRDAVNITAGRGVAVREFPMKKGHGEADYLLFVDGAAAGVVEAKKEGETLTGVEIQTTHGGGGISIGFDAVSLHLNMLQLGIVTVKVVYDEERQQKLISGLLDYLLHGDLPAAALDPFARKYWPDQLISWNRLLAGRWRDPLVGRDVLIGILFGCVQAFSIYLVYALPLWFRIPRTTPFQIDSLSLGTAAQALGYLLGEQSHAIIRSLGAALILVFARLLLRRKASAVAVTYLVAATLIAGGENYSLTVPLALLIALLNALVLTIVLVRFGILAYGTCVLIKNVVLRFPATLDLSRWYAGRSVLALSMVLALAIYGFRCALGRQAAFGGLIAED